MQVNPNIFKAYDIRGVYQEDLNEDLTYNLGLAFAGFIKKEAGKDGVKIAVGGDMRTSTPLLKESLIKGLTDAGADVLDMRTISTPTFYFGVSYYNCDGGVMVSASHNPKEWNGFKLTREEAKPISAETGINEIRDSIMEGNPEKSEQKGKVEEKNDVLKAQFKHDLEHFNPEKIKTFKIAIDPANGMGAQYAEKLFDYIPCKLIKMNFKLDGTFPAHEADPIKNENLEDLKQKIVETHSDLGIAIDGDGDRIFFLDEKGKPIDQSIIRGLLAKMFLEDKPGSKIGYDIRPGKITEDLIRENGGTPVQTKVGHSLIKAKMIEEDAYFAGESSGHFFLKTEMGCFEVPVIIIGKLLEEFSKNEKAISEQVEPYKKYYHSGEINSEVEDKQKVFEKLEEKYSDGEINKLDGITIEFDQYWFNVRGSNTEEKVRLNLEARDKETMEEKRDEILEVIRNA